MAKSLFGSDYIFCLTAIRNGVTAAFVGNAMTDSTEKLRDELFALEEGFWLQGRDHFLAHLDEHCLIAFPQAGEMHGVKTRDEVAATASTQPGRWKGLKISGRHFVQPAPGVAIISYRADVKRFDGEPYPALVSSAYARREDGWKLAFHQHSPL